MKSIQQLRERAAALANGMDKMLRAAGDRKWSKDEQAAYDALNAQFEDLKAEIEDMEANPGGSSARNSSRPAIKAGIASGDDDLPALRSADDFRSHYIGRGLSAAAISPDKRITLTDFLRAKLDLPSTHAARNALTEGTDSAGGYTVVPSVVMPEILEALVPNSALMQAGAAIAPLTDPGKSYTLPGIQSVPTAAWRAENGAVAESDPVFRAVIATPRSLAVYFKVSRELLADSPGMNSALRQVIGQAFAKEMDRVGLRGTGIAPQPSGILTTVGIQAVSNGTNGASLATTKFANFSSAIGAVMGADAPMPTAAIMAPRSRMVLAGLADTTGQPLLAPPLVEDLKLLTTSQIPINLTVGSSTDCSEIYVGDFSQVRFVLRENLSVQVLDQAFATTGQIGLIAHMRLDVLVPYSAGLAVITGVKP